MVSKNRRLSGAAARTGDFKKIRVNNVQNMEMRGSSKGRWVTTKYVPCNIIYGKYRARNK